MISTPATRAHAQDVLDFITLHPEKHDQAFFNAHPDSTGCGTTMCIAGTSDWLVNGHAAVQPATVASRSMNNLGLSDDEAEVVFFEMDESRAVNKLKKIAIGEPLSDEDFFINNGSGMEDETFRMEYLTDHQFFW